MYDGTWERRHELAAWDYFRWKKYANQRFGGGDKSIFEESQSNANLI